MTALVLFVITVESVLMELMNTDVNVLKDLKELLAGIQQMNVKESSAKMEASVLMDTMNTSASANMDLQASLLMIPTLLQHSQRIHSSSLRSTL